MLTLCEDAVHFEGTLDPHASGVYYRAVGWYGVPEADLKNYATEAHRLWQKNKSESAFPEWLLQDLDQKWMTELPSVTEIGTYAVNTEYVRCLLGQLGEHSGKVLERLAEYVLSCIPGCRTARGQNSQRYL